MFTEIEYDYYNGAQCPFCGTFFQTKVTTGENIGAYLCPNGHILFVSSKWDDKGISIRQYVTTQEWNQHINPHEYNRGWWRWEDQIWVKIKQQLRLTRNKK